LASERPAESTPTYIVPAFEPETEQPAALPLGRFRQTFRALRHRNFRLLLFGQAVSLIGTWMQNVAQSWLVYRLTHSELLLGTAWFCSQIPVFAFGSIGGVVSDRYSRHKIILATQILSMLQACALGVLTLSGHVRVWHILLLAFGLGTINAFDMPARQALIVQLAGKEDLLNAISLNSAVFNAARILGPAVAGLLVAALGEGVCFVLNSASFLAVIVALLAMRMPRRPRRVIESSWSHLLEGLRYTWRHVPVRSLLMVLAATTVAGMPLVVLMPFFADAIFHRGSQGLGFLLGAMGAGAVIGTLVLAQRERPSGLHRIVIYSALATGASYMVFSASPSFYLSLATMPVIGFSVMRQNAAANTSIQMLIPDEYRGRIMSLYVMTVVGLGPFGSLAAGAVAHAVGPRFTVFAGGVVAIAAGVIFHAKTNE
jgi:MFS family permease